MYTFFDSHLVLPRQRHSRDPRGARRQRRSRPLPRPRVSPSHSQEQVTSAAPVRLPVTRPSLRVFLFHIGSLIFCLKWLHITMTRALFIFHPQSSADSFAFSVWSKLDPTTYGFQVQTMNIVVHNRKQLFFSSIHVDFNVLHLDNHLFFSSMYSLCIIFSHLKLPSLASTPVNLLCIVLPRRRHSGGARGTHRQRWSRSLPTSHPSRQVPQEQVRVAAT